MSIAIVTDSTADIPSNIAEDYPLKVVPAILVINGHSLEDGHGISRREFYEQLPEMESPPTTAIPSSESFRQVYEQLFEQGFKTIVSIHVASLLSGMISSAQIAAKSFGDRIRIIDSEQVTLGLGFQALAAAEASVKGVPLEAVLARIENVRQRVRVIAMLDTLEYIRRSGRVSWARARIGTLLRIKPFIELKKGVVHSLGQTRTRNKGKMHLKSLLHRLGPLEYLAILHSNAENDAQQVLDEFRSVSSNPPFIVNVTSIIGTHVGPNGLGFAAVVKS